MVINMAKVPKPIIIPDFIRNVIKKKMNKKKQWLMYHQDEFFMSQAGFVFLCQTDPEFLADAENHHMLTQASIYIGPLN